MRVGAAVALFNAEDAENAEGRGAADEGRAGLVSGAFLLALTLASPARPSSAPSATRCVLRALCVEQRDRFHTHGLPHARRLW